MLSPSGQRLGQGKVRPKGGLRGGCGDKDDGLVCQACHVQEVRAQDPSGRHVRARLEEGSLKEPLLGLSAFGRVSLHRRSGGVLALMGPGP